MYELSKIVRQMMNGPNNEVIYMITDKELTLEGIRKVMIKKYSYHATDLDRDMIVVSCHSNNTGIGCYLFSIDGSPPKGYGIYIPESHTLCLYDAWGKRYVSLIINDAKDRVCVPITRDVLVKMYDKIKKLMVVE
jgi:hypothetical protein